MNDDSVRNRRKNFVGVVVGKSGDKTLKVSLSYKIPHPVYKKEIRRKTILYVHDLENRCNVGDSVLISETRPLSRLKRWRVVEIVKSASMVGV